MHFLIVIHPIEKELQERTPTAEGNEEEEVDPSVLREPLLEENPIPSQ